ncbi:hypothetical protein GGE06_001930 [Streptomyces sp. SFB5A]|uniref:Transposase n=1 Tax=Streptomyces nymphaeiformis TaxID=2663842 RepID=A0A7W7TX72_9ACTN|nr:hypothetical protein [Streptomyces nymphaeiformis]
MHDSLGLKPLVRGIPPIRSRRRPRRRRPAKLHADKGYSYDHLRRWLCGRGIRHRIARKGVESAQRLGRHRWVVERTASWTAGCVRRGGGAVGSRSLASYRRLTSPLTAGAGSAARRNRSDPWTSPQLPRRPIRRSLASRRARSSLMPGRFAHCTDTRLPGQRLCPVTSVDQLSVGRARSGSVRFAQPGRECSCKVMYLSPNIAPVQPPAPRVMEGSGAACTRDGATRIDNEKPAEVDRAFLGKVP